MRYARRIIISSIVLMVGIDARFVIAETSPTPRPLVALVEALQSAKEPKEMDGFVDALVQQRLDVQDSLTSSLYRQLPAELKARICYLLGYYKAEMAISALIRNIEFTIAVTDEDRSARWRSHPCAEALAYIGKPAERNLISSIMDSEKEQVRELALEALVGIEGQFGAIDLLERAKIGAEKEQTARLEKALGQF